MTCLWCGSRFERQGRRDREFCGRKCRQAAFRLRGRRVGSAGAFGVVSSADPGEVSSTAPGLRFAYADPPYPGCARRFYRAEASYAGEVDHRVLVESLVGGDYAGWALSTSARALREVLPLCPAESRVCVWVKPIGAWPKTRGLHNTWEPVIVVPGRRLRPGKRDWLLAQPARFGGSLMGRKPVAFCGWLFDILGMLPGDELVDLFPGTGIVSRAWSEVNRWAAPKDGSRWPGQLRMSL